MGGARDHSLPHYWIGFVRRRCFPKIVHACISVALALMSMRITMGEYPAHSEFSTQHLESCNPSGSFKNHLLQREAKWKFAGELR